MMPTATAVAALILGAAVVVGPQTYRDARLKSSPTGITSSPTVSVGLDFSRANAAQVAQDFSPALPKATVDVREPATTGRTIHVAAGESLQSAIDAAQPGDRITLEAGATYEGPFKLRRKDGDAWIVIASNRLRELPAGTRVNPSQARHMPRLTASSRSAIITDPGAHHYRFAGIEVAPAPGEFLHNLIELGGEDANLTEVPHHIVFDRAYIHGDPRKGGRRGIALNGRDIAVINSYVSDFKEAGADSQAMSGWNGPGPFKIENNYLEGAGENVMFGGADPAINGLVPSDIEILRNHFAKPLRWTIDHPTYEGTPWTVKNLFELKNARRVLVEGNLLEHNWPHAQNGFAILFTPRNQEGRAPWSVVEDVTFRNNVIRHVAAGFNILGRDDNQESRQTRRILIHNNVLSDVGGAWGGNGRLFQLLDGTAAVSITNNTAERTTGGVVFGGDHDPHTQFVFQNNVMPDNGAGFVGSGTGVGRGSIDRYFPGAVIKGNVFPGGKPEQYPLDNLFARDDRNARRAGADVAALMNAMEEVTSWRN
jgi:hypothetical protein